MRYLHLRYLLISLVLYFYMVAMAPQSMASDSKTDLITSHQIVMILQKQIQLSPELIKLAKSKQISLASLKKDFSSFLSHDAQAILPAQLSVPHALYKPYVEGYLHDLPIVIEFTGDRYYKSMSKLYLTGALSGLQLLKKYPPISISEKKKVVASVHDVLEKSKKILLIQYGEHAGISKKLITDQLARLNEIIMDHINHVPLREAFFRPLTDKEKRAIISDLKRESSDNISKINRIEPRDSIKRRRKYWVVAGTMSWLRHRLKVATDDRARRKYWNTQLRPKIIKYSRELEKVEKHLRQVRLQKMHGPK